MTVFTKGVYNELKVKLYPAGGYRQEETNKMDELYDLELTRKEAQRFIDNHSWKNEVRCISGNFFVIGEAAYTDWNGLLEWAGY